MNNFYKEIYKLKNIERKGWKIRQVCEPSTKRTESDAEHTCSMCLLALKIINQEKLNLNTEKVLKMCLYHELCEIDTGDHTLLENIPSAEKYKNEFLATERISNVFQMPEILDIWQEFENKQTPEAKFVKIIDKLDAVIQAKIYAEKNNRQDVFIEFYNNALPIIGEYKKYV